jgi:3-phenylpropionate/trans-cinnamate dioxygenase ferredoxin reductase component
MKSYTYAIVGGGVAAARAAEAIRSRDTSGSVAIFTREWAPPYQRPPLSKEFLQNRAPLLDALVFPPTWYLANAIDLHCGVEIMRVEGGQKRLEIKDGEIGYERLLLATGATPRMLDIPGTSLDGVYTLRTFLDANRLRGVRSSAHRVVMIGSGFIGMEVAASLRSGGCDVTVVETAASLYARFGTAVSDYAKSLFGRHGIETAFQTTVVSIEGTERVSGVVLSDGRRLDADAVVIGIGVMPDVALAQSAGLTIDDGIVVNNRLCTSSPDIYAAGDVARFPGAAGHLMRVEHFDNAYTGGAAAGANMAGADEEYAYVPYFWSDVFELSFEFVGDPGPDGQIVEGTLDSGSFVVEYRKGDRLCGALLAQRTPEERDTYRNRLSTAPV